MIDKALNNKDISDREFVDALRAFLGLQPLPHPARRRNRHKSASDVWMERYYWAARAHEGGRTPPRKSV
jgi:hypothetical protein